VYIFDSWHYYYCLNTKKFWAFCWYALRNRQHPAQISTPFLLSLIRRKSTTIWDFFNLFPSSLERIFPVVSESVKFSLCTPRRHKRVQLKIHPCLLLTLDQVRIRLHVPAALAAEQLLHLPLMERLVGLRQSGCFGEQRRSFRPKGNPKTNFRSPLHSLAWVISALISVWQKEQFTLN